MSETSTYRIEIQASNADGTIWQTMHVEHHPRKIPAEDIAPATAFELHPDSGLVPPVAGIVWEPFDARDSDEGLPRIMYQAFRLVPAQELAELTAENQNIAEGDGWRVRIYLGDGDTHVAEAGPASATVPLAELVERLRMLPTLPGIERAREAEALRPLVGTALATLRRAAVYESTRGLPWSEVAAQLGVSEHAIGQLITAHRNS